MVGDRDGFYYEQPVTFSGGRWFTSGPVRIGDEVNVGTEYYLHVVVVDQAKAAELDKVSGAHREPQLPGRKLGTTYVRRNQTNNC